MNDSRHDAARHAELSALRASFPGVVVWYGQWTRRWWAIWGGVLVEGNTPGHLGQQLARRHTAPTIAAPPPPQPQWQGRPCLHGRQRCGGWQDCACRPFREPQ